MKSKKKKVSKNLEIAYPVRFRLQDYEKVKRLAEKNNQGKIAAYIREAALNYKK